VDKFENSFHASPPNSGFGRKMRLSPEGISGLYFRRPDLSIIIGRDGALRRPRTSQRDISTPKWWPYASSSLPLAVAEHFINFVGDGLHIGLLGRIDHEQRDPTPLLRPVTIPDAMEKVGKCLKTRGQRPKTQGKCLNS